MVYGSPGGATERPRTRGHPLRPVRGPPAVFRGGWAGMANARPLHVAGVRGRTARPTSERSEGRTKVRQWPPLSPELGGHSRLARRTERSPEPE